MTQTGCWVIIRMNTQNHLSWFRFLRPTLSSLTAALKTRSISSNDLVLYLLIRAETALEESGYKRGEVELTINQLTELTGYSRSTIKRSLVNLREQGYLSKINDYGQAGRYVARDIATLPGEQVATWDYVPRHETQLLRDLNNYVRGDSSEAPAAVHIENLQINIQVNHFHDSEQEQPDKPRQFKKEDMQSMIEMIENSKTPPTLREILQKAYTQLTGAPGQW